MKALVRYTAVVLAVALVAGLAAWPFLDAAGRVSLGWAAAVTVPAQIGFFALLSAARQDALRFMVWWGLGVLGRMVLVALVGLTIRAVSVPDPSVLMMSTVGFFFVFILLEPAFMARGEKPALCA